MTSNHQHTHDDQHRHEDHSHGLKFLSSHGELYFAVTAGILLAVGYILSLNREIVSSVSVAFFIGAYFFGGFFALLEAVENIRNKKFEIDALMIVAAAGAAALGQWAEGALLLTLFSIGHALEHYAMGKAKKAIEALAQLAPKTAWVVRGGTRTEVAVEELTVGDIVLIKPDERIPVDGTIVKGSSSVNQAPITGESMPIDKIAVTDQPDTLKSMDRTSENNRVYAGTINGSGSLEVSVTKLSFDTTLAKVAKMVSDAEAEASPTQLFTKKFEKYFVPFVLIGVFALLFAFLVISEPFSVSFYRAMAVLVAASPCALAISTPSAVLSGIARAGKAGILIKSGAALENLGKVTAIAFDKTGTLTEGTPVLTDIILTDNLDERSLLKIAAAVELESDHPLAQAVVAGTKTKFPGEVIPKATNIESLTGKGIRAEVEGKIILIGKPALFENQSDDTKNKIQALQNDGRTIMVISSDDTIVGIVGIMDSPRKSAPAALTELKAIGVKELIMLSGDNQKVASSIAKQIGLTEAIGDLMPEDKVATIKRLQSEKNTVAMVGDGVNDAPAMASASVGIAMGAAGSDVALETADVALMTNDLTHLAFAVGLSRKASGIIKQNLWISLGMVSVLIPATLFGLGIGPAVILHEGSTVIVVFNALRLLAYQK